MLTRISGLIIFLFSAFQLKAQNIIVEKYSDKQGLNHSVVYRVFQDSQGLIWAATDNGLNRYDGNEFTSINNQSPLVSDYLFGMAETRSKLWFTSYNNGVIGYDLGKRTFNKAPDFSMIKKPIDIYVHKNTFLVVDNVSCLWVFQNKKLLGKIEKAPNVCIVNDRIYFGNSSFGIKELVVTEKHFSIRELLRASDLCIIQILPLKNGNWLVIETESLLEFNPKTKQIYKFSGTKNLDLRIVGYKPAFIDSNGDIWFVTSEGRVYRFQQSSGELKLIFENTMVNEFFEDSNKNLWIATYGFGLWRIPPLRADEYTFNGHLITDFGVINKGNSSYFFGYRQLYLPSKENQILRDINRFRKQFRTENGEGIVYADEKQFFYSHKHRLFYCDWKNFSKEVDFGQRHKALLISQILSCGKNEFIITSRNGAFCFNGRTQSLKSISRLENRIVYSVNKLNDQLAFCTDSGVFMGKNDRLLRLDFPNTSNTESIRSVLLLSEKKLLVGSNKRLFYFDKQTRKMKVLYEDVYCSRIIKAYGFIWVLCDKGLIRIDKKQNIRLISSEYGIPGWAKSMIVKNDRFYILYQDKILEIAAGKLLNLEDKKTFRLFTEYANFEGENHSVVSKTIALKEPLKKMVFKFTIPKFMDVKTASYFVKINDEVELEGSRTGKFNILSLPDGNNKLTFYALNEDKKIIAREVYYIHNPYPYWRHPMMQILYLLVILLGSWFVFSWRIKKLNQRKALEMETNRLVYELKQKSLLNMLNPHFLNNAINSIQAFVVMNDQRKTLKYLSQFARLMRLNLELMNSSMVPLSKEVDSIRFYVDFEQVRTSGTFEFEVETRTSAELSDFLVPSFIIQPFVENAIWHGILTTEDKKGKILLIIEERPDDILIIVDDDGIGISKSMSLKSDNSLKISLGTKIIRERFEILKSGDKRFAIQIIDKSDLNESGTRVIVTVPKTIHTDSDDRTANRKK